MEFWGVWIADVWVIACYVTCVCGEVTHFSSILVWIYIKICSIGLHIIVIVCIDIFVADNLSIGLC